MSPQDKLRWCFLHFSNVLFNEHLQTIMFSQTVMLLLDFFWSLDLWGKKTSLSFYQTSSIPSLPQRLGALDSRSWHIFSHSNLIRRPRSLVPPKHKLERRALKKWPQRSLLELFWQGFSVSANKERSANNNLCLCPASSLNLCLLFLLQVAPRHWCFYKIWSKNSCDFASKWVLSSAFHSAGPPLPSSPPIQTLWQTKVLNWEQSIASETR